MSRAFIDNYDTLVHAINIDAFKTVSFATPFVGGTYSEFFTSGYSADATGQFVVNDRFKLFDGLHLTPRGKAALADQFSHLICKFAFNQNFKSRPSPRIPKELQILTQRFRPKRQPEQPVLTEKDRALAKYIPAAQNPKHGPTHRNPRQALQGNRCDQWDSPGICPSDSPCMPRR